ncbi:MAG: DUF4345 domain-containing protein [Bacteroidota bacterium]
MKFSAVSLSKNLHLLVSAAIVVPVGIIYGSPDLLPAFFDISVQTTDVANMLKANMVLYLGASGVWILGMIKPTVWQRATELNVLFMLTLASGRMLSMVTDGLPSGGYIFGVIAELAIGLYAVKQLQQHYSNFARKAAHGS